jgi:hypothetical protein
VYHKVCHKVYHKVYHKVRQNRGTRAFIALKMSNSEMGGNCKNKTLYNRLE